MVNDCLLDAEAVPEGVRLLNFNPHTGDFREILDEDNNPNFYITHPLRIENEISLAEETIFSQMFLLVRESLASAACPTLESFQAS